MACRRQSRSPDRPAKDGVHRTLTDFPPLIDDPDGRIVNHSLVLPGPDPFVVFEQTFEEPGRYFFMCEVLPHFAEGGMYGWVIVH